MNTVVDQKEKTFITDLLELRDKQTPVTGFLHDFRVNAAKKLLEIPLPTTRDEEWKYTNLRSLYRESFDPFFNIDHEADIEKLKQWLLTEASESRVVFVNGTYNEELSSVQNLPENVVLSSIESAANDYPDIIEKELGKHISLDGDPFIPLNNVFWENGIFLHVPKETKIEKPIHFLFLSTENADHYLSVPRVLIVAEPFSKFTVLEDHLGLGQNVYFNCPVTEVNLKEGSKMLHIRTQRESRQAYHISRVGTTLAKTSNYESYSIQLGSKISRNDVWATLNGEQIDCTLDGLVLINGKQHSDTHTMMDHKMPYCTSHQLHKCIIDEDAHSVFNGKIYVRKGAQKTDSFQENRNLLLSDNGTVDTKPQLEIYADDVKCSHGATVGQFEDDEVFYLKSRGLDDETTKELLSYGFALQIIEQIPVESLRKQLSRAVANFTKSSEEVTDMA
jgi:Fe-S cluster assembly protein SufD